MGKAATNKDLKNLSLYYSNHFHVVHLCAKIRRTVSIITLLFRSHILASYKQNTLTDIVDLFDH